MAAARILRHHDYTVAWVCALPLEMAAAKAMLDEIHANLPTSPNDQNTYLLGRICGHNVIVACLPSGVYGTTSAAAVANQMLSTFRSIRFGLMVGIGEVCLAKELIFDWVMWWSANRLEALEAWCSMILAKQSGRVFLSALAA